MKIIIKLAFLIILLCYSSTIALSLDPKKSLKQYIHETWNTSNGLPQNAVSSIVQSNDGYLWFATQEGVVRFDGFKFTIYDRLTTPELHTSNISTISKSPDGSLWFTGNNGIGHSRLKNGKFIQINKIKGFPQDGYNSRVIDSSGNLWFSTSKGLKKFNGETFTDYSVKDGLPNDTCFQMYVDRNKRLWIVTANNTLTVYENGKFTTFQKGPGIKSKFFGSLLVNREGTMWFATELGIGKLEDGVYTEYLRKDSSFVQTLFEDSKQNLYLGTDKGLEKFENGSFIKIQNMDGTKRNAVKRIYEDREGTLWIVTNLNGLQRLSNGLLESFTVADGLSGNDIRSIYEDKEGSLWIGTYGGGLDRLRDTKFLTYNTEQGLSENLAQTIFEDSDSNLWVGTFGGGVNRFKNGKNTIFTTKDNLASNSISAIAQDKSGAIWVATTNGLGKYVNGKFTTFTTKDSLLSDGLTALLVDDKGTLWLGGFGGVVKHVNEVFSVVYRDYTNTIYTLLQSKDGTIWAGGENSYGIIKAGKYTHYPLPESLKTTTVYSLYEDLEGNMWLGLSGVGLLRIKNGSYKLVTPHNGLYDFNAYCLLDDQFGNLWSACNKGIYRVSIKELNDFCDGKIPSIHCVNYGTADGMKNNECNGGTMPCAWKLHDGSLAFSTVKGVAIINPAEIKLNTVPPSLVIEQMVVDQNSVDPGSKNVFKAGTEKFQFTFAGISFLGGDKVKYKYKLEPFETEWVDAGNRREAFYTHIVPGDYTFRVIAANSDGIWNEAGVATSFTLQPFFYQSSWFIGICIIGLIGVGPGIYFLRIRQLKNKEAELRRIVEERTTDLQKEKEHVEKALSELKDAQRQLVLSEKMASLGQLTAGIAHEIKNPLNFVNNFSSLSNELVQELQEELEKKIESFDDKSKANIEDIIMNLRQNVTKINEHGKRADSIVRGMLLHSRGKTGERQQTDINALLSEYTNLAYHGLRAQDTSFNVKIETHFDESLGKVNIVPQDLSRVFLNIINNACYAAHDKKKSQPSGYVPTISVSSKILGDKFEVRIRDNGNGIPQSVIDKIFNPFFTTKPAGAGTGLGLSLSYDIVTQEHNGEIKVDTKQGEYAEFIITIPTNLV